MISYLIITSANLWCLLNEMKKLLSLIILNLHYKVTPAISRVSHCLKYHLSKMLTVIGMQGDKGYLYMQLKPVNIPIYMLLQSVLNNGYNSKNKIVINPLARLKALVQGEAFSVVNLLLHFFILKLLALFVISHQ